MPIAQKVFALLHAITREEIKDMPPFVRRQLAERCRAIAEFAEQAESRPRSGVLYDLKRQQQEWR